MTKIEHVVFAIATLSAFAISAPRAALASATQIGGATCTSTTANQPSAFAGNYLLNCDAPGNHLKPTIAVNPTDPSNVVATSTFAIDATLQHNKFIQIADVHVTTDGGSTWTTVQLPLGEYNGMDDTSVAFDAGGRAYVSSLAVKASGGATLPAVITGADVVVWRSSDGGLTWIGPFVVAQGVGTMFNIARCIATEICQGSGGLLDARPRIAVDPRRGSVYVVWTEHQTGTPQGAVFFSRSTDRGSHWSHAVEIGGSSASLCPLGVDGACDLDGFPFIAVAPDGSIDVTFFNYQRDPAGPDIVLVRSTDGGVSWSAPGAVTGVLTGTVPPDGLTGCTFPSDLMGGIAVSSAMANRGALFVVFGQNASPNLSPTRVNLWVVSSTDGGGTWSAPVAVNLGSSDQILSAPTVGPDGILRIGYQQRDPSAPGTCSFGEWLSSAQTTASSRFRSIRLDTGTPGDTRDGIVEYTGAAVGPDGVVWTDWTDFRQSVWNIVAARVGR